MRVIYGGYIFVCCALSWNITPADTITHVPLFMKKICSHDENTYYEGMLGLKRFSREQIARIKVSRNDVNQRGIVAKKERNKNTETTITDGKDVKHPDKYLQNFTCTTDFNKPPQVSVHHLNIAFPAKIDALNAPHLVCTLIALWDQKVRESTGEPPFLDEEIITDIQQKQAYDNIQAYKLREAHKRALSYNPYPQYTKLVINAILDEVDPDQLCRPLKHITPSLDQLGVTYPALKRWYDPISLENVPQETHNEIHNLVYNKLNK